MDRAFRSFAKYLEKEYGVLFDREEGFVICPECGEPLYQCDWDVNDYSDDDDNYICPVCGENLEAE